MSFVSVARLATLTRALTVIPRCGYSSSTNRLFGLPVLSSLNGITTTNNTKSCVISRMASDVAAGLHTKVDKDLVTFLDGEVDAEKQQHQPPKSGPGVPGFEVKAQKARIMLTKKFKDETITIKFNINGTVGTEEEDLDDVGEQQGENPDPNILAGDMKSRPDFVVEIAKPNGKILAFTCRLYAPSEIPPDQPDADRYEIEGFGVLNAEDIDEDGDWAVDTYVGDGGIIDGQMYDLLMNYLDSRGLGNEFVDHFVDFATYYEHNQYINLLDNLKSFLSGK